MKEQTMAEYFNIRHCGNLLGEDMETFYVGIRVLLPWGFDEDASSKPVACSLHPGHDGLHSSHGVVWDDQVARRWAP